MKLEELVGKSITEAQFDEAAGKKDACYHKVKSRYDVWPSAYASGALVKCRKVGAKNWGNKSKKEDVNEAKYKGYDYKRQKRKDGLSLIVPALRKSFSNMKDLKKYIDKHGKMEGFSSDAQRKAAFASGYEEKGKKKKKEGYPGISVKPLHDDELNESYDIWAEDGSFGYTMTGLVEAEYGGRKVKLGKPMQGDVKKFKVYVKNPKGNVVKVNFGQGGDAKGGTMRIRKSNPKARANFRARHNCDSPGPRHKARYWSCRKW